jgi:hypothetical protein
MAKFLYKCRNCGEIEYNPRCSNAKALKHLHNAVHEWEKESAQAPSLRMVHVCGDKSKGVADLIGYMEE